MPTTPHTLGIEGGVICYVIKLTIGKLLQLIPPSVVGEHSDMALYLKANKQTADR